MEEDNISRRHFLKVMGGCIGSIALLDTTFNLIFQSRSDNLDLCPLLYDNCLGHSAQEKIIKRATKDGVIESYLIHVSFGDYEPFNYQNIENKLKKIFRGLDEHLDVRLDYEYLKLNSENADKTSNEFKTFLTSISTQGVYDAKIVSKMNDYLKKYVSNEKVEKIESLDNIEITVADFGESSASASEGLDKSYIFIRNRPESMITYPIAHEIGHSLGLSHSITPDIMSYSCFAQLFGYMEICGFGPESKYVWNKIKRHYENP